MSDNAERPPRASQQLEKPRQPLGRTLAILFCSLILAVIVIYSGAAYIGMRNVILTGADQRLANATEQWTTLLSTSGRQAVSAARRAADSRAVRDFIVSGGRTAARAAVDTLRGASVLPTSPLTSATILDARGTKLTSIALRPPGLEATPDSAELQQAARADSGRVGRFHLVHDSIVYATIAPVRDNGTLIGYVLYWRRLGTSTQSRDAIRRMIGEGANLYLGDDAGQVWNDLVKPVEKPPIEITPGGRLVAYERPGAGKLLGYARNIPGTSWRLLLEFPASVVDAPVRTYLQALGLIAVGVLIVGLGATLAVSRSITGPLEELVHAVEATAGGSYTGRVQVRGQDEVSRVARSFNAMVDRIREAHATLEERVKDRTRELQERNDDLEAFGYSISHDLRAPLRAMQGFSQIILEDYGDRLDEKGRSHAQRIVVAAKRMDELIRDLLAYSRLSRANLATAPVSLEQVVKDAVTQLEAELQRTGAKVEVNEPLPPVKGHQSTLSQVVANLVGNGMKFARQGVSPEVRVRAETMNGTVRLWVEDNGIGIRPEHQQRIFNVFERLHTNDQYPGTGIGLAIVKKGMERMGGRVGVESVPDSGSRFWIELPRVGSEAA